jgi:hypothetical protein
MAARKAKGNTNGWKEEMREFSKKKQNIGERK